MILRPAKPDDAATIADIWNPVIRETAITFNSVEKTPADICALLAQKAADGHPFLLAIEAGTPIGFATYGQFRGGAGYARTMEHSIILAPEGRGRGAGRALMGGIEGHARAAGVLSLWAGVSAANPGGVAFHLAMGFAHVALLPDVGWKFGRSHDLVLLRKPL